MDIRKKALLAALLGNSIFGFSFLFSKIALEITIPSVMLAIRFTTAFVVLNLIVLAGRMIKKKNGTPLIEFSLKGKPWKSIVLLAIFQPVIYFFAESNGIALTSSAFAGTIIAVVPLVGVIFDVVIMHEKVSKKQMICSLASIAGVVVTTIGAKGMKSSSTGVLLLLIAVSSGAFFYVFSKKSGEYYNPLERTYVMFGIGSAAYIILGLIQSAGNFEIVILPAVTSFAFWRSILYLSVVSSIGAFMLLNFCSSYISVSEASIFANFTTVISIIAGVVIMKEPFTLAQIIGAVIIVGSVYLSSVGGNKEVKK